MNYRTLITMFALGAAALSTSPAPARAQCRPEDIFCAELRIGPAQPPPVLVAPPPPVVVAPPPVVYVQPAPPPPPPVVILQAPPPPPPPQVFISPPPPPPRVVYQPPPPVYIQAQPRRVTRYELVPAFDMGLHFNLAGLRMENAQMGGVQGAFRIRPAEFFAVDLGLGGFVGDSLAYGVDRGGARWEMPLTADFLFFFNPQHAFQFYALVGVGVSYAEQELSGRRVRALGYLGGEAGLGVEWRLSRHFALNLDVRGFLRQHVGDDGPEFVRQNADGTLQSTDLSGGAYGTMGLTVYFGP